MRRGMHVYDPMGSKQNKTICPNPLSCLERLPRLATCNFTYSLFRKSKLNLSSTFSEEALHFYCIIC
jgi:hypothetical protein